MTVRITHDIVYMGTQYGAGVVAVLAAGDERGLVSAGYAEPVTAADGPVRGLGSGPSSAAPTPSWNVCRVYGVWRRYNPAGGAALPRRGTWVLSCNARITTLTDVDPGGGRLIFPAGQVAAGTLDPATGALQIDAPCVDDPDVSPRGFQLTLTVTFDPAEGGGTEVYPLSPTLALAAAGGIDLGSILLPETLPTAQVLIRGVPGGLAGLDSDGDVIDANGVKVTGSGTAAGAVAAGSGGPRALHYAADAAAAAALVAAGTAQPTDWIAYPSGG